MSIAGILIDALKDKLTEYDKTTLITGFQDLESASPKVGAHASADPKNPPLGIEISALGKKRGLE